MPFTPMNKITLHSILTVFIKLRDLDQPDTFVAFTTNLKSFLNNFMLISDPWHDQTAEQLRSRDFLYT